MKLIKPDIIIIVGFLLWYGAFFMTTYTIVELSAYTELAKNIESNPVVKEYIVMGYYSWVVQSLQVAFVGALYFIFRRKWWEGNDVQQLGVYLISLVIFLMFLQNFLHDLPIFLKVVVSG